ncbi:MAG: hypothetical protein PHW96_03330 [Candidatus Nanoarchaeia archaeon]|nr:hypothetical protein [Candidatus Nanoarchaeia archaeon]
MNSYKIKLKDIKRKKILLDECVNFEYMVGLSEILDKEEYYLMHVNDLKNLKGKPDEIIADYIDKHEFDIFITCDSPFLWRILNGKGYKKNLRVISVSPFTRPEEKDIQEIHEYVVFQDE